MDKKIPDAIRIEAVRKARWISFRNLRQPGGARRHRPGGHRPGGTRPAPGPAEDGAQGHLSGRRRAFCNGRNVSGAGSSCQRSQRSPRLAVVPRACGAVFSATSSGQRAGIPALACRLPISLRARRSSPPMGFRRGAWLLPRTSPPFLAAVAVLSLLGADVLRGWTAMRRHANSRFLAAGTASMRAGSGFGWLARSSGCLAGDGSALGCLDSR